MDNVEKLIARLQRTVAEEELAIGHAASLPAGNRRGGLSQMQKALLFAEIRACATFARALLRIYEGVEK